MRGLNNIRRFMSERMRFLEELRREHGRLAQFSVGKQKFHLVCQPERVREILVTYDSHFTKGRGLKNAKRVLGEGLLTSEGDFHKKQRRLMQPVFNRQKVLQFAPTMIESALHYQQRWADGVKLDLAREMTQLTLIVVGKTLFDTDVEQDFAEVEPVVTDLRALFEKALNPYYAMLERFTPGQRMRVENTNRKLDRIVYRLIEDHRANPRNDLLSMLIEALEVGTSDRIIRDEVLTLYLAGHETTAYALTWTLWIMSFHPRQRERLFAEVRDHQPGPASYGQLTYTEAAVLETLRLYPPAWIFGRTCVQDVQLEGLDLRAGDLIILSPFLLQRDPEYFTDPLSYRPERWLETPRSSLPKYCYFPFGAGSRVCIGEHFALLEAVLVLAVLFKNWDFEPIFGNLVKLDGGITLRPSPGAYAKLLRRKGVE